MTPESFQNQFFASLTLDKANKNVENGLVKLTCHFNNLQNNTDYTYKKTKDRIKVLSKTLCQ